MGDSLKAYGAIKVPVFNAEGKWDNLGKGTLRFDDSYLYFQNERVKLREIKDAVLNYEKILFVPQRQMMFRARGREYAFNISTKITRDYPFPFEVEITENVSFMGKQTKFVKFMFIALVGLIAFNLFMGLLRIIFP